MPKPGPDAARSMTHAAPDQEHTRARERPPPTTSTHAPCAATPSVTPHDEAAKPPRDETATATAPHTPHRVSCAPLPHAAPAHAQPPPMQRHATTRSPPTARGAAGAAQPAPARRERRPPPPAILDGGCGYARPSRCAWAQNGQCHGLRRVTRQTRGMAQSGGSIGGYSPWALEKSRACGDQVDEKASSRRGRLGACSKVHKLIEPETTSTARSASAVRVLSAVSARVRSATSTRVADGAGWGGEAGPSARASFKLRCSLSFQIETT